MDRVLLSLQDVRFRPTYCENVAVLLLHSIQELGNVFSKFEGVTQPWNRSFVKRRFTFESGHLLEKQKETCLSKFVKMFVC